MSSSFTRWVFETGLASAMPMRPANRATAYGELCLRSIQLRRVASTRPKAWASDTSRPPSESSRQEERFRPLHTSRVQMPYGQTFGRISGTKHWSLQAQLNTLSALTMFRRYERSWPFKTPTRADERRTSRFSLELARRPGHLPEEEE